VKRLTLVLISALVLLTACSTKAQDHNAQDVGFAQGMIPHHRQALDMSSLAATQASSPKVKDLAQRISAAQDPEIRTMTGWLSSWGEPETAGSGGGGGMPGMNHGGGSSDTSHMGMMTDAEMAGLRSSSGAAFDKMFLTMMIEHHKGAIEMSRTEVDKGKYGPAKQLAETITAAQQKEIDEMQGLLSGSL